PLADWIRAGKILARERVVDERHVRPLAIALREQSAGKQTDSHRAEVIRRHRFVAQLALDLVRPASFDRRIVSVRETAQSQRARRADSVDARQHAELSLDLGERTQLVRVFRVADGWKRDLEGDGVIRIETWIDLLQANQAAHEER